MEYVSFALLYEIAYSKHVTYTCARNEVVRPQMRVRPYSRSKFLWTDACQRLIDEVYLYQDMLECDEKSSRQIAHSA